MCSQKQAHPSSSFPFHNPSLIKPPKHSFSPPSWSCRQRKKTLSKVIFYFVSFILLSVRMDSSRWPHPQGTGYGNSMEGIIASSACNKTEQVQDRKMPKPREQLNCPRCNSSITKFCYYNNYSLTQPRYFCKTCRRYWTEGGSLRNVPVGGGSRKNKKSPSSSSSSSSASSSLASAKMIELNPQNLKSSYEAQDLTLSFPKFESNIPSSSLSAFGGYNNAFIPNLMPDSSAIYSPGFSLQELKPAMGVSADGFGSRYGMQESNGGMVLFPFADFKQISSTVEAEVSNSNHGKGQGSSTGYWNEMSNGGSW